MQHGTCMFTTNRLHTATTTMSCGFHTRCPSEFQIISSVFVRYQVLQRLQRAELWSVVLDLWEGLVDNRVVLL